MAGECNPSNGTTEIPKEPHHPPNVPVPRKRRSPAHHAQRSARTRTKGATFTKGVRFQ